MKKQTPTHLHTLDALRGVAALVVVAFHYSNLMTVGDALPPSFSRAGLPFHDFIPIILDKGWLAVDLFFTLSGFVFFWLYSKSIADRSMMPGRFFMLRFSRLYPLHVATLVFIAAMQLAYASSHPDLPFFVVKVNDWQHFMLHLGFISNWLPSFGYTFNSPVWSVSVEVLLYILFFVFCRYTTRRVWAMSALSIMGWWLIYRVNFHVGRGVGSFFAGGLAFVAFERLSSSKNRHPWANGLLVATAIVWTIGLYGISRDWSFVPAWLHNRTRYFPVAIMFPVTVLTLALWEERTGMGKPLAWLGDISYSTYLLHFPLQIVLVMAVDAMGMSRSVFYSPWAFIGFFALLIPISAACFHWFERPAQRALRRLETPAPANPKAA